MKNMNLNKIIVIILCLGMSSISMSKVKSVSSESKIIRALERSRFVALYLYRSNKNIRKDREARSSLSEMDRTIKELSRRWEYKEGDLDFVKANVEQDTVAGYAQRLGVQKFPSVVLFRYGQAVTDKSDKSDSLVILSGDLARDSLITFINKHLGEDLSDRREYRQEERERRREERRYYWSVGWPYYSGWGYPYYGYYGYGHRYYGPRGRFGFGFHL